MELKQLLNDDRGVSPVIGVILMVAITVILAAVIGTFVLGLGSQVGNSAPQATFNYQYQNLGSSGSANYSVAITDQGGQSIPVKTVNVSIGGTNAFGNGAAAGSNNFVTTTNNWASGKITAGDMVNITKTTGHSISGGQKVHVIWHSSGSSGSSSIISSSTTPS